MRKLENCCIFALRKPRIQNNFIKTGKLDITLKKTGNFEYNISQSNDTRGRITKKYANEGVSVKSKTVQKYLGQRTSPIR